jgi:hypothetical protein
MNSVTEHQRERDSERMTDAEIADGWLNPPISEVAMEAYFRDLNKTIVPLSALTQIINDG